MTSGADVLTIKSAPAPNVPTKISLQLCEQALFPQSYLETADEDELATRLFQATRLRLNDTGIEVIENLEMFTALQYLHLHHNSIRVLENLEFHPNLIVLAINDNKITSIACVECLHQLQHLNASSNCVEEVDEGTLPQSLQWLNLSNNPACWADDYRMRLVGALPELGELDTVEVTAHELAAYGFEADDDDDEGGQEEEGALPRAAHEPEPEVVFGISTSDGDEGGSTSEGAAEPQQVYSLDVPATVDAMSEGILSGFRAKREELAAASRARQEAYAVSQQLGDCVPIF